ncbi:Monooxygenase FAD-binding protein [Macrophomina phaseolina MS6]|uniref:Monooxygenase FAD-binding protein n=1 Tax=Macrophomina phaseolina (strain MS6) TaxID=1126212 RepID=K2RBQ0_MACPH|nr:Monooxygenase FAD-binding protein [Macrophomina phaseolina MS6]
MAQNLKIVIVGAGIGGLTAAIALRQQGHKVEVFERSRLLSEVGAAIHVAPNFTVILNRLGVFPEEFGGTEYRGMVLRDAQAEVQHKVLHGEERKSWQAPYWLVHRVDLHNALRNKATSKDGFGSPVTIHTASAVVDVDCTNATITLADGTTATGDVVLAADGVHSVAREIVTGGTYPTKTSGKCCYRWLLPQSVLNEDPELQALVGEPGIMTEIKGAGRRIVLYPCKNGQLMNCAAFVPVEEVGVIQKGWNQSGNKEKLLQSFSGYAPQVLRFLEMAPEGSVAVWDLLDMPVLPTWVNGRVALLGDAAHPFLPCKYGTVAVGFKVQMLMRSTDMGQGAAQAIEDAAALGALLPLDTAVNEIPRRLRMYEKCRKERADVIQEFTRVRGRDECGRSSGKLSACPLL